jgi:hypothetical protein
VLLRRAVSQTFTEVSEVLPASIIKAMNYRPDDGVKYPRNVGKLLPNYMTQQLIRQPFSPSPLSEPEISPQIRYFLIFPRSTLYSNLSSYISIV